MRPGRCKYPAHIITRIDRRTREEAGAILRREGKTVAGFIRDQLAAVAERGVSQSDAR